MKLTDLTSSPNALREHYSRFRAADRLLLTGHSHQAWPDAALDGIAESFAVAANDVDHKWDHAMAKADEVRHAVRSWLHDSDATIALGSSVHDLLIRIFSSIGLLGPGIQPPKRSTVMTTDMEFHSSDRQLRRMAEEGLTVDIVPAAPASTLVERMIDRCDSDTAAVILSSAMFTTSQLVPHLDQLAEHTEKVGTELIVDAYHHVGPAVFSVPELGLHHAWVVGGGYKYLQWGEAVCYARIPDHATSMRPVVTGWQAAFGALSGSTPEAEVAYGPGAQRFAGSTYDPTSHYRAARVAQFFTEAGLTPKFLAEVYQHQLAVLIESFDAIGVPESVVRRDFERPVHETAGFLSLITPHASQLQERLMSRGLYTDARREYLRFGPAPYLSDDKLRESMAIFQSVLTEL